MVSTLPRPVEVAAVPGTPYGLAIVPIAPTVSGLGIASLVVGVGSVLVSLVVGCFGLAGASAGWGPIVAGAFAILAGLSGAAAVTMGATAVRQIRRIGALRLTGRGMAVAGLVCGAIGITLTVAAIGAALALA